ncbi:hydroxymethylbilane synthase [Rhodopirellula halodulae]|uniref:hydroxymethylbilane synthase n=1 Tax=Rhodopirellula halodulae TaxID=2894198 RepID=UPI002103DB58|nr:hydroxymethylbilane synthase [Rhodopirellula sp. JC737]
MRIATRESPLAMWQAEHVAESLKKLGISTDIVPLVSKGDTDMRPIDATRQVGLFTKRIQQALVDGEADVAVHSLKDLPTEPDDRFLLAAVPPRESVLDGLVFPDDRSLPENTDSEIIESPLPLLPQGARIGTGSTRRLAQLMYLRPDLQISPIRGNVQTRLAKLNAGEFDAIVLAHAGILRLEMTKLPFRLFPLTEMLPAPGQGALGIEVRSEDAVARDAISRLNHAPARAATTAERTVLSELHGGCLAPIACHATVQSTGTAERTASLRLEAVVMSADGSRRIHEVATSDIELIDSDLETAAARQLGVDVARSMRQQGADELIRTVRDNHSN